MNRRAFLGSLFAAPVVGPSIVRGLSKAANTIAPHSAVAQDLSQFLYDQMAAQAVNLEQLKAGAAGLLGQSVKLVADERDAIGLPIQRIAQRHAESKITAAVRDAMQTKKDAEQSKQRTRNAFKEMEP